MIYAKTIRITLHWVPHNFFQCIHVCYNYRHYLYRPLTILFAVIMGAKVGPVKKYIILGIKWIVDTIGAILQAFGIKLCVLSKENVMEKLTDDELVEVDEPDVAVPFGLFMKVCSRVSQ